jgi:hypothetical protein
MRVRRRSTDGVGNWSRALLVKDGVPADEGIESLSCERCASSRAPLVV